jgi:hypothetical protein
MIIPDRFKAAFTSFVKQLLSPYDYAGVHGYTVVSQNTDFTLELSPDDPDEDPPLSNVPIQYDNPAFTATIKPNAKCNVMYTNKDPSRYFCFGFTPGSIQLLQIGDVSLTSKVVRDGDLIASGGVGQLIQFAQFPSMLPAVLCTPTTPPVPINPPYLVSFGSTPVTAVTADPLYGTPTTGSEILEST